MQRFSILGLIKHVFATNEKYFRRAAKRQADFMHRVSPLSVLVPGLERFPSPVQTLLTAEITNGKEWADDGMMPQFDMLTGVLGCDGEDEGEDHGGTSIQCDCRFFRKWRLPCCHLWHHHFANNSETLTETRLLFWSDSWEEHGYELYEVNEAFKVPKAAVPDAEQIPAAQRVEAREVSEVLMTYFYELERAAHTQLGRSEGQKFVGWWISKMRVAASELGALSFDSWRAQKN